MLSDLDSLLLSANLDGLYVSGASHDNPAIYYLLNGAHVGERTFLVKKRGMPAVVIAIGMEREEAAKSGLQIETYADYQYDLLVREMKGNALQAYAALVKRVFAAQGISGKVGVFGRAEQGETLRLFAELNRQLPDVEFCGQAHPTVIEQAQLTKSPEEMVRLRNLAERALTVVAKTRNWLASCVAVGGVLRKADGTPLTVGEIHAQIRTWTYERNMELPDGFIFAIGRDAGIPHSRGTESDVLKLGESIVFDYFPREAGSGYFYDFTRTWCLGFAPEPIKTAYQQVQKAFQIGMSALRVEQAASEPQRLVNDYFESVGHPTTRSHPGTASGYVHSLGHGVGLGLHEFPTLSESQKHVILEPGCVLTVEPGLYYPERGFGIRIEDFVWLNPQTLEFETIGEFDQELVIPVKSVENGQ